MSLHYLVDGYNLLYALPEIPAGSWEQKRDTLLRFLQAQGLQGHNQMTVVFDSRQGLGDRGRLSGIDIVFTAGETADDWIARYVREIKNPRVIIVVSDDRGIQNLVRGTGAKWISSKEFLRSGEHSARKKPFRLDKESSENITEELKKKWLEGM